VTVCRYFERAYREMDGEENYYVGLEELCFITRREGATQCE
jgi:hypothetical protein